MNFVKNLNPLNMVIGGGDEGPKKEMSAAEKKMNFLNGYQAYWYKARRSNWYYFIKCLSIGVSIAFAAITLSFKRTTQIFMLQELQSNAEENATKSYAAYHILTIYWFLFIYFSLSGMDEMIEAFSVRLQMEKGALGLFFELNYLIGIFLTGYIFWFVNHYPATDIQYKGAKTDKTTTADFHHMYNWLYVQFIYFFFSKPSFIRKGIF